MYDTEQFAYWRVANFLAHEAFIDTQATTGHSRLPWSTERLGRLIASRRIGNAMFENANIKTVSPGRVMGLQVGRPRHTQRDFQAERPDALERSR
jgi:hypothetical protein